MLKIENQRDCNRIEITLNNTFAYWYYKDYLIINPHGNVPRKKYQVSILNEVTTDVINNAETLEQAVSIVIEKRNKEKKNV